MARMIESAFKAFQRRKETLRKVYQDVERRESLRGFNDKDRKEVLDAIEKQEKTLWLVPTVLYLLGIALLAFFVNAVAALAVYLILWGHKVEGHGGDYGH